MKEPSSHDKRMPLMKVFLVIAAVAAGWVLLQKVILPKLGVPT